MKRHCIIPLLLLILCSVSSSASTVGEDTLSILFTGDVLLDRGVRKQIEAVGIDSIMSGVRDLFLRNDAVMINLECPLASKNTPVSKQIVFRADTIQASALKRNGVTHAALANNHSIDQGFYGLEETATSLSDNGIVVAGYGKDYSHRIAPVMMRKGDVEVAVFNNNAVPLENWARTSADKADILNISTDSLCHEIQRFSRDNPSCKIVVYVHWGTEFNTNPNITQHIDAMKLLSAGACAIVGHHPHVIQRLQYAGEKPIFFSLGNFIFDQKGKERNSSIAVELHFTEDGLCDAIQHHIRIEKCRPTVCNK